MFNGKTLSIKELVCKLKNKEISIDSLIDYYLKRIKDFSSYNVFIHVRDREELIKEAEILLSDPNKQKGKLFGIPFAVKDSFTAKGTPTTAGDKYLKDTFLDYDSVVVEKLKEEGAILIGKTNMDSWGFGGSTENSAYGTTLNPFDKTRIPGGSSGGSAAAVSLDLCVFSIGEDTGGSIRNPASHCGVFGIKPTYGRVSRYGCIAYASSLDSVGVFSKNLDDLELVFGIISSHDQMDMTYVSYEGNPINNFGKFYYSLDLVPEGLVNPKVRELYLETIKRFESQGFSSENKDFSDIKDILVPTYYITAMAEASTNLARYNGTRYGYLYNLLEQSEFRYKEFKIDNWKDLFTIARTDGFGQETKRRIVLGAYMLMEGYYDAYYQKAQEIRSFIRQELKEMFKKGDFLLLPVTPTIARKIGEFSSSPTESYLEDIYTVIANLTGMPSISFPVGYSNGLPIGMQILGDSGSEEKLVKILKELTKG